MDAVCGASEFGLNDLLCWLVRGWYVFVFLLFRFVSCLGFELVYVCFKVFWGVGFSFVIVLFVVW